MEQIGYSEKVMEHFMNPRNVGTIENPDGCGKVGNPVCGDIMEMFISVEDDTISDIKFRTFGCGSAIATSSMVTELAKGMHIDKAMEITRKDVADELDGLPRGRYIVPTSQPMHFTGQSKIIKVKRRASRTKPRPFDHFMSRNYPQVPLSA